MSGDRDVTTDQPHLLHATAAFDLEALSDALSGFAFQATLEG